MRCFLLAVCVVVLISPLGAAEKTAREGEFVPLFDGKTFDAWEGSQKYFRIEDEAIVAGNLKKPIPHNEFLCTKKQYGDFELRLKFKVLGKRGNGGVQLRSRRIPNTREVSGYQADIGEGYWGSIFDESRRRKMLAGPPKADRAKPVNRDDWNDYVIRCEGPRIQLWINGQQTVDYTEPDASIPQKGIIGLQVHSGRAGEVWYKDIRIKEMP